MAQGEHRERTVASADEHSGGEEARGRLVKQEEEEQQECGRQSSEAEGGHVRGEEPALCKNREGIMNLH